MLRWLNAFVSEARPDHSRRARRDVRRHQGPHADHPRRRERLGPPQADVARSQLSDQGFQLIDPPWPEDAWERAGREVRRRAAARSSVCSTPGCRPRPRSSTSWAHWMPRDASRHVTMWTSQFSDASSAVCTRLSGTRARSALRRVTRHDVPALVRWARRRPRRCRPSPASTPVRVVVGAPADVGQHARGGSAPNGPNALAHNATAVRFSSSASAPAMSTSTWRRLGGIAARSASTTPAPIVGTQSGERLPCRRVAGRAPAAPTGRHRRAPPRFSWPSAYPRAGRPDHDDNRQRVGHRLAVDVWPGITPRLLRPSDSGSARGLRRRTRRPAVTRTSTTPTDCSTRSTAADCSAAVAQRSRSPSSCARCATPAGPAARRCARQRRGGRTGLGQGPLAAAQPTASGARRRAARRAHRRRRPSPTSTCPTRIRLAHSTARSTAHRSTVSRSVW